MLLILSNILTAETIPFNLAVTVVVSLIVCVPTFTFVVYVLNQNKDMLLNVVQKLTIDKSRSSLVTMVPLTVHETHELAAASPPLSPSLPSSPSSTVSVSLLGPATSIDLTAQSVLPL